MNSSRVESVMSISKGKEELNEVCKTILREQGVRCYFCEIIGKRWSFLAGDKDIIAAPVRYMINDKLGVLADKEITDLDKYI